MRKPRDPAWKPDIGVAEDIYAMQALAKGEADADQQGRALKWIIEGLAGIHDEPFRSDEDGGERETSFALGRAFVGRQIIKMINCPPKVAAQLRGKNG